MRIAAAVIICLIAELVMLVKGSGWLKVSAYVYVTARTLVLMMTVANWHLNKIARLI